jgi:fatty acid desaturase
MQEETGAWIPPGAADIALDRKLLKSLMRRSDRIALGRLCLCLSGLVLLGWLYARSFGTWAFWPMLFVFGGASSLTFYSLSHECAHGTVFRSRWLNETAFWIASLLFGQEVLYRRYSHASHHTYTMFVGKDAQMPIIQPAGLVQYVLWYTGFFYHIQSLRQLVSHSIGRFSARALACTPAAELGRVTRNSRLFLGIYLFAAVASMVLHSSVLLWFWLLPKLAGDPVMMAFAGSQHFEMKENDRDLRTTTRSLRANRLIDLFYWNMSYHIEHHLYPTVPFHALPRLNAAIRTHLPRPLSILGATREIVRTWWARVNEKPRTPGFVDTQP